MKQIIAQIKPVTNLPSKRLLTFIFALIGPLAISRAADYTWDANADAGITDGAGTWGGTATAQQRWRENGTGALVFWPNGGGNNAALGGGTAGTASVVTILGAQTMNVGNITFNAAFGGGSYTISPNTATTSKLNLGTGGANTITVNGGVTAVISCILQGTSFSKEGGGTLTLFGSSSTIVSELTGPVKVNAGTVELAGSGGNRNIVSAGGLWVGTGATFLHNANADYINNSCNVTNAGGLMDFGQNETIGSLVLESGTITNSSTGSNRTLTSANPIVLQSGLIAGNSTRNFNLAGAVTMTKSTAGTVILGPFFAGAWTGASAIENGTLKLVGNSTIGSTPAISLASNATLDVSGLSSTFAVGAAQTLAGSGTVNGNLSFVTGATVKPGYDANKLTISGNLTLNNTAIHADLDGATLGAGTYRLINYSGTKSGVFSGVTVVNGTATDTVALDQSVTGRVDLVIGTPCNTAIIDTQPVSKTGFAGGAVTFSLASSSTTPNYQWQISTDNGSTFNDVSTGSGGNSAGYTTGVLSLGDSGSKFRCIVSVPCDSSSITSSVATLTVGLAPIYHSAGSGTWTNLTTWEMSSDDGANWTPATNTPTAANTTSIKILNGHSVTSVSVIANGVDDLTIEAGGALVVSGAAFTINNGANNPDVNVLGTLSLANVAGSTVTANGQLQFENGGKFSSALTTATPIPTATWATNSTCEISVPSANGGAAPSNLGQTFGNFIWHWPNMSSSVIVAALTTVKGDFTVTAGGSASVSALKLNQSGAAQTLTVDGNVHVAGGYLCLAGNSTLVNETLNIGGNLIVDSGAFFDGRNSGGATINVVFANLNGSTNHTLNNAGTIGHSGGSVNKNTFVWQVNAGETLTLASDFNDVGPFGNGSSVLNVDGTLDVNGHVIGGAGFNNIIVNAGGTLKGNGVNAVATVLGDVTVNGTLDINQSLPTFAGGEVLPIFSASSYNLGAMTINPGTPPGAGSWDTTTTPGSLIVVGGVAQIHINNSSYDGVNFYLSGSAGADNAFATFSVLTNADFSIPRTSWNVQDTGTCDGNGDFNYSAPVSGDGLFYDIRIP